MEPSIFTKIINGDVPSHKLYEDATTIVFLDINPSVEGHMLVVPKAQVDRLEDLSDDDYLALMTTVKKAMNRLVAVYGPEYRACLKVIGFDVRHAHVHVKPCRDTQDFFARSAPDAQPDHAALAVVAKKLAFS